MPSHIRHIPGTKKDAHIDLSCGDDHANIRRHIADGTCLLEVTRISADTKDRVSIAGRNLRIQATRVLDTCVRRRNPPWNQPSGGRVRISSQSSLPNLQSHEDNISLP